MTCIGAYAARVVTGLDANGVTYDPASTCRFATYGEAADNVATATMGKTWDVFYVGTVIARIHPDGGIDRVAS